MWAKHCQEDKVHNSESDPKMWLQMTERRQLISCENYLFASLLGAI